MGKGPQPLEGPPSVPGSGRRRLTKAGVGALVRRGATVKDLTRVFRKKRQTVASLVDPADRVHPVHVTGASVGIHRVRLVLLLLTLGDRSLHASLQALRPFVAQGGDPAQYLADVLHGEPSENFVREFDRGSRALWGTLRLVRDSGSSGASNIMLAVIVVARMYMITGSRIERCCSLLREQGAATITVTSLCALARRMGPCPPSEQSYHVFGYGAALGSQWNADAMEAVLAGIPRVLGKGRAAFDLRDPAGEATLFLQQPGAPGCLRRPHFAAFQVVCDILRVGVLRAFCGISAMPSGFSICGSGCSLGSWPEIRGKAQALWRDQRFRKGFSRLGLRLERTLYVEHSDCAERKWQSRRGHAAIENLDAELAQWLAHRPREAYAKAWADLQSLRAPVQAARAWAAAGA